MVGGEIVHKLSSEFYHPSQPVPRKQASRQAHVAFKTSNVQWLYHKIPVKTLEVSPALIRSFGCTLCPELCRLDLAPGYKSRFSA